MLTHTIQEKQTLPKLQVPRASFSCRFAFRLRPSRSIVALTGQDFSWYQYLLEKTSIQKKTFSFGYCPNEGGRGLPMPEFFGPFSRSAFLVNKKSLFLQKCQCIELLTVFQVVNISPSPPHFFFVRKKRTKLPELGSGGGGGGRGFR